VSLFRPNLRAQGSYEAASEYNEGIVQHGRGKCAIDATIGLTLGCDTGSCGRGKEEWSRRSMPTQRTQQKIKITTATVLRIVKKNAIRPIKKTGTQKGGGVLEPFPLREACGISSCRETKRNGRVRAPSKHSEFEADRDICAPIVASTSRTKLSSHNMFTHMMEALGGGWNGRG